MKKLISKAMITIFAVVIGSSFWVSKVAFSATGSGHTLSYSSVDSGEIRYGGSTKHTDARSHSFTQWNAMSTIDILPDTATTIQDLTFTDVYSSESWTGQYVYSAIGADTIKYNDRFFETRGAAANKKTATHELGHALGLADHYADSYSNIIMYGYASEVTTLKSHDKEDYNDRW